MKSVTTSLYIFVVLFLFLSACSEEIKPSTDGKETAVIYAVLNANDSIHYVKINKAFYGGGNLTETALIPDSSYFQQVEATITEYINGNVTRTWLLTDTLIENKKPGAFYSPEQKVYYFKTTSALPLRTESNVIYKLEASINNGQFEVKGETSLVGDMKISQPTDNSQFSFATDNVSQYGYASTIIGITTGNAKKLEVFLDVEFEEYNNSSLLYTKSFRWKIADVEQEDIKPSMSLSANGQTFYDLIKLNVTNDPTINKRVLKGIYIRSNGASNDLQKYMLVDKPSSSLAQNKISYTNLTVSNDMRVAGIFASRYNIERYKPKYINIGGNNLGCLNNASMKELCTGQITGQLFFCSDNPSDINKNYFCN